MQTAGVEFMGFLQAAVNAFFYLLSVITAGGRLKFHYLVLMLQGGQVMVLFVAAAAAMGFALTRYATGRRFQCGGV